jgi:hypothetical protein
MCKTHDHEEMVARCGRGDMNEVCQAKDEWADSGTAIESLPEKPDKGV